MADETESDFFSLEDENVKELNENKEIFSKNCNSNNSSLNIENSVSFSINNNNSSKMNNGNGDEMFSKTDENLIQNESFHSIIEDVNEINEKVIIQNLLKLLDEKNEYICNLQNKLHNQKIQLDYYLKKGFDSCAMKAFSYTCEPNLIEENIHLSMAMKQFCKTQGIKTNLMILHELMTQIGGKIYYLINTQDVLLQEMINTLEIDDAKYASCDAVRNMSKYVGNAACYEFLQKSYFNCLKLQKEMLQFRQTCDRILRIEEERNRLVEQVYSLPIDERVSRDSLAHIQLEKFRMEEEFSQIKEEQKRIENRLFIGEHLENYFRCVACEGIIDVPFRRKKINEHLKKQLENINSDGFALMTIIHKEKAKYTQELEALFRTNQQLHEKVELLKKALKERDALLGQLKFQKKSSDLKREFPKNNKLEKEEHYFTLTDIETASIALETQTECKNMVFRETMKFGNFNDEVDAKLKSILKQKEQHLEEIMNLNDILKGQEEQIKSLIEIIDQFRPYYLDCTDERQSENSTGICTKETQTPELVLKGKDTQTSEEIIFVMDYELECKDVGTPAEFSDCFSLENVENSVGDDGLLLSLDDLPKLGNCCEKEENFNDLDEKDFENDDVSLDTSNMEGGNKEEEKVGCFDVEISHKDLEEEIEDEDFSLGNSILDSENKEEKNEVSFSVENSHKDLEEDFPLGNSNLDEEKKVDSFSVEISHKDSEAEIEDEDFSLGNSILDSENKEEKNEVSFNIENSHQEEEHDEDESLTKTAFILDQILKEKSLIEPIIINNNIKEESFLEKRPSEEFSYDNTNTATSQENLFKMEDSIEMDDISAISAISINLDTLSTVDEIALEESLVADESNEMSKNDQLLQIGDSSSADDHLIDRTSTSISTDKSERKTTSKIPTRNQKLHSKNYLSIYERKKRIAPAENSENSLLIFGEKIELIPYKKSQGDLLINESRNPKKSEAAELSKSEDLNTFTTNLKLEAVEKDRKLYYVNATFESSSDLEGVIEMDKNSVIHIKFHCNKPNQNKQSNTSAISVAKSDSFLIGNNQKTISNNLNKFVRKINF